MYLTEVTRFGRSAISFGSKLQEKGVRAKMRVNTFSDKNPGYSKYMITSQSKINSLITKHM